MSAAAIDRLRLAMAQQGVFRAAQDDGRAPDDFVALHEVAHALDLGLDSADPEVINRALRSFPLRSRLAAEVTAMAAAFALLARLDVATSWTPETMAVEVVIAARRHAIRGTPIPWRAASIAAAIRRAIPQARAQTLADRILAQGAVVEVPRG